MDWIVERHLYHQHTYHTRVPPYVRDMHQELVNTGDRIKCILEDRELPTFPNPYKDPDVSKYRYRDLSLSATTTIFQMMPQSGSANGPQYNGAPAPDIDLPVRVL
jgi:hypothetical protein